MALSRLVYKNDRTFWISGYRPATHPKGCRPGQVAIVGGSGVVIRVAESEVRSSQASDKTFHEVFGGRGARPPNGQMVKPKGQMVTVVNVKNHSGPVTYIGRACAGRKASPLANPFKITATQNRNQVCDRYLHEVLDPAMDSEHGPVWNELNLLADRVRNGDRLTLGCWCVPERCHGYDVAAAITELARTAPQPKPRVVASSKKEPTSSKNTAHPTPTRAITLHRPWAYAVAHLGKSIENRTWKCPLRPGEWLAIHAGKKWDKAAPTWVESMGLGTMPPEDQHPTGIVAVARFHRNITESDSLWFVGPVGWEFDQVVAIDPIPARGKQGIWGLSGEQQDACRISLSKTA